MFQTERHFKRAGFNHSAEDPMIADESEVVALAGWDAAGPANAAPDTDDAPAW